MPVTAVRYLEEARERVLTDLARRAFELWQRLVVERTQREREREVQSNRLEDNRGTTVVSQDSSLRACKGR